MAGILNIPNRLTSDLDFLSVRKSDCKTRDHTAEDIKSCRTIFYDCFDRPILCVSTIMQRNGGVLIIPFSVRAPGRGASSPTPDNPIATGGKYPPIY